METGFLDRLANQLKANKTAICRRAIQRILVRIFVSRNITRVASIRPLRMLKMSFEGW
jgi:predicted transcriptional regulator